MLEHLHHTLRQEDFLTLYQEATHLKVHLILQRVLDSQEIIIIPPTQLIPQVLSSLTTLEEDRQVMGLPYHRWEEITRVTLEHLLHILKQEGPLSLHRLDNHLECHRRCLDHPSP